jgi:hypothetical protein
MSGNFHAATSCDEVRKIRMNLFWENAAARGGDSPRAVKETQAGVAITAPRVFD